MPPDRAGKAAEEVFRRDKGFQKYVERIAKSKKKGGPVHNPNLTRDEMAEALGDYLAQICRVR